MRHELTDYEWAAIKPFLPNKPRDVPRVNDPAYLTARRGAICRITLARTPPPIIASFVGAELACGISL